MAAKSLTGATTHTTSTQTNLQRGLYFSVVSENYANTLSVSVIRMSIKNDVPSKTLAAYLLHSCCII